MTQRQITLKYKFKQLYLFACKRRMFMWHTHTQEA